MTIAVVAQGLEVRYGTTAALRGVDISVPMGASLAVVGANGSGKSTLLGALAGTHKPSAGDLMVSGGRPALVLQATEVDESLPITVRDAVKMARYPTLGLFRRFGRADNEAVDAALTRMQVADLADSRLHELSGGERQRVLVAQGLAQDSPLLLLDEPMTGLDLVARQLVLDVIDEEKARGRTVITTTHSLSDASACDLVLMLATEAVAFGPPFAVLNEANIRATFGLAVSRLPGDLVLDDHHHAH